MTSAGVETLRKKLVIVGDGAAGKTSLLIVFTSGHFPLNHIPTVFDNHLVDVFLDNQVIQLALWDTAGQEDYARLRPLSYPGTDCLLVCFSIDSPSSFENVENQWQQEISHYCPRTPFLLIGCKTDLRQDPLTLATLASQGQTPVSYQQGVSMAERIKAWRYMECSAKLNEGVSDVFEFATRAACWSVDGQGGGSGNLGLGGSNSARSSRANGGRIRKGKQCVVL